MHFHIMQGKTYQFKALPFGLSTAPMDFTVVSKEVKLLCDEKGYKNPPVPRRLVGHSQIPPNLSSTHTNLGSSLSTVGLASERGKNQNWNPNKFLIS